MKPLISISFLIAFLLIVPACKYAMSPWETDVDCPGLTIEENVQLLERIEQEEGIKDHFKVAIMSDPQLYPEDFQSTIEIINKKEDVDFVILAGDLVETGIKQEYEWTCKALSHLDKPIVSVIGNHDTLSYGKEIWLKVVGEFDFSFVYQNTKFIAYNDNRLEFKSTPDKNWIEQKATLKTDEIRYHTIGISHIAPWSIEPELSRFLKEKNFDLAIHGHDHRFDYSQLEDVQLPHYITANTKGKKFGLMTVFPNSIILENCSPECIPAVLTIR